MIRSLTAALVVAIALACASSGADDKDPVKEKLFAAKVAYDKEMRQYRTQASEWFDKREDAARNAGNKKLVDQIKVERKAFDEEGELPKGTPAGIQKQPAAAKKKLEAAYGEAVKDYTKAKKDTEAGAVEAEWKAFMEKNTGAPGMADDTTDFLNPENWEGYAHIWTLDAKARTIVGEITEAQKNNTFFCSKKKYSDFELSCKVLLRNGDGNSGVQIRSEVFDAKLFRVKGPQADIGKGYWGDLHGEGVGGMMKAADPAKIKKLVKESEFNDYRIIAKGMRITIKINGATTVDQNFPTLPGKDAKPAPRDGIIAFQMLAGYPKTRVEFKDIKFTDLSKKK